jgi:hypothetical protein
MLVSPCGVVWRGPVQGRKGILLRARARQSRWSSKNVTDHLAPQDPARGREFFHGPGYELCHGVVFRVQRAQVMPLRTVDEELGDGLKELDCEFPVLDPPAIRGLKEAEERACTLRFTQRSSNTLYCRVNVRVNDG